jgi:SAM-dependent methyltransferase
LGEGKGVADYFELRGIDERSYKDHVIQPWLESEISSFGRGARVLDFGCGFGQNLHALKRLGFESAEGCDINSRAILSCVENGLKVSNLDISSDFYDNQLDYYDIVYATHVLEHIPIDAVVDVLRSIKKILRPGGKVVISVPNAQAYTGPYWRYEDFTHHTLYTSGSLKYILLEAGFSQVQLIDRDGTLGGNPVKRLARILLINLFKANYRFWKRVLGSPTHLGSEDVLTWEVKMCAIKAY